MPALLKQLRGHGLVLSAAGDQLLVQPRSALTEPLRETIRASKAAILGELEDEASATRKARQAKVERELRAHPERKRAFDVADAPLKAAPGEPVSVVLAVRHGEQILSGELRIPRERWDLVAFVALMESPERPQ
jgi:hypothetical protein